MNLTGLVFLGFFDLNKVRVSDPQRHPYTQTWVKYPPPLSPKLPISLLCSKAK